eukprot:1119400-Pyramimonas_sp.AAC.1
MRATHDVYCRRPAGSARRLRTTPYPPNMTWSRLLVPFIWGTATEDGRATLEHVFEATGIPRPLVSLAAERWQQTG